MNFARYGYSRPAIERMHRIARLLRAGRPFFARELARECECGRKTIQRDMTFMRDRLGWAFAYDRQLQKYRLTKAPAPQL